jgi:metallo-beta-lactamase class B
VGSRDLASYLVVTPAGDILINSNLTSSVSQIRHSVEELGFRFGDIKILLISHAHSDHDSGSAAIKQQTGAQYMVMDGDVPAVESGGRLDFSYPQDRYPATKVDRVLHDGDTVTLGDASLVAHKTPGHTPGCTTWSMRLIDRGQPLNVLIVGSWFVNPGYRLIDQPRQRASYPGIANDYRRSFALLRSLPCDVFLGAHGMYFGMLAKLQRLKEGSADNVWIDPQGFRAALAQQEADFNSELARQQIQTGISGSQSP